MLRLDWYFSSPPIWPHHWRAHQLTLVMSARKYWVQGHSADLPGTAQWCPSVPTAVYISRLRPDKDFGLPPRSICVFLLSDCLLLDTVLSLSLALVFGTLFLLTSLQHLIFCVVLVVAVCYLGHSKNSLIDWLIELQFQHISCLSLTKNEIHGFADPSFCWLSLSKVHVKWT